MPLQVNSDQWIAASLASETLCLWKMHDQKAVDLHTVQCARDIAADEIGEILSQTGWDAAPIYACGLQTSVTANVPTSAVELPIKTAPGRFAPVHGLANVIQADPFGQLGQPACMVAGFLSLNPNWNGVICIVLADRSYWVLVSADEIVSFASTLTPQMGKSLGFESCNDMASLQDAVKDSLSRPEALAVRLSSTLFDAEITQPPRNDAAALGWGYLIGAELAATRPYWLGQNLALLAPFDKRALYAAAFESQYLPFIAADTDDMTLAGLRKTRQRHIKIGAESA